VTVAALFVDPRGVYSGVSDVELWDEARDAATVGAGVSEVRDSVGSRCRWLHGLQRDR
jgi:hypothetical protein